MSLIVSDPTYAPPARPGRLDRALLKLILDPRDLPLVHTLIKAFVIVYPLAGYLFLHPDFNAWLGVGYYAVTMGYLFAPVILMHHNSSHRPLFRPEHAGLRHLIPWGICPFFGLTPGTYFAHHIGMHHVENNLVDDLSSTMPYQRDRLLDFLRYVGKFYLTAVPALLVYFRAKKRDKLFRMAWIGELSFLAAAGVLLALNWRATLVVFVIPMLGARFNLMMGNWTQHAFVDRRDPGNPYKNSTTCINNAYNRNCFNDGYHIGHHVKGSRHWTEMPADFARNQAEYARQEAVVFDGIDYVPVFFNLMLKRYDWLASRHARLGAQPPSRKQLSARLRERTRKISAS